MTPPARSLTLADLLGRWQLVRDIAHEDGTRARFTGWADWRPTAQGALCRETGTLSLNGGQPLTAERVYLWDGALVVRFADGRFFHQVPGQGGTAHHDCPPDSYRAEYDFADWPVWRCVWHVHGPRKAYTMTGQYRRAAA